jgi:hypothetical protein
LDLILRVLREDTVMASPDLSLEFSSNNPASDIAGRREEEGYGFHGW